MKPALLTDSEVQTALDQLTGWIVEGGELVKTFKFSSYLAGIDFVSHLAQVAEAANHHPDILIQWRKVTVRLSTHSAGGLTQFDVDLARQADVASSQGTTSPEPV